MATNKEDGVHLRRDGHQAQHLQAQEKRKEVALMRIRMILSIRNLILVWFLQAQN